MEEPTLRPQRDPIADEAFALHEAWEERRHVRADVPDLQIDPFRLARGEERPHDRIRCVPAEGRRLLDVVGTTYAFLKLVSPRYRRARRASLRDLRARAFVSLLADPPGRPLYARYGFVESAPDSIGMGLLLR